MQKNTQYFCTKRINLTNKHKEMIFYSRQPLIKRVLQPQIRPRNHMKRQLIHIDPEAVAARRGAAGVAGGAGVSVGPPSAAVLAPPAGVAVAESAEAPFGGGVGGGGRDGGGEVWTSRIGRPQRYLLV